MSAILSACGTFRYELQRDVDTLRGAMVSMDGQLDGKVVAFFGINPSTADAIDNDPTVRRWIGFCHLWGATRFIVGNAFAFRSKNVKLLREQHDPIGPENDDHLHRIASQADMLVPCWGARNKLPRELQPRLDYVLDLLRSTGKPLMCFGTTPAGDPLHPLYLPYTTELRPLQTTP